MDYTERWALFISFSVLSNFISCFFKHWPSLRHLLRVYVCSEFVGKKIEPKTNHETANVYGNYGAFSFNG